MTYNSTILYTSIIIVCFLKRQLIFVQIQYAKKSNILQHECDFYWYIISIIIKKILTYFE